MSTKIGHVHFFKFDLIFRNIVMKMNQTKIHSYISTLIQFRYKILKIEVKLEKMNRVFLFHNFTFCNNILRRISGALKPLDEEIYPM